MRKLANVYTILASRLCGDGKPACGGAAYNAKRQPKLPFVLVRKPQPSRRRFLARVTLAELLDATCSVDDFLLARIERVACRAHFDVQRFVDRRTRRKRVAAAARHLDLAVLRMDTGFHQAPVRWADRGPVASAARLFETIECFQRLSRCAPGRIEELCAGLRCIATPRHSPLRCSRMRRIQELARLKASIACRRPAAQVEDLGRRRAEQGTASEAKRGRDPGGGERNSNSTSLRSGGVTDVNLCAYCRRIPRCSWSV
jgi:hypothetical protein